MSEVKIEDVVYSLDSEFKKALDDTMAAFAGQVFLRSRSAFQILLKARLSSLQRMGKSA